MFNGRIQSIGPRYCPSIEDKIDRFADKDQHQIFVEPEGWDTVEIYVNGFSTSLPEEVQYNAIRKIEGFENAKIFRPGYAIEYDYFPPTQLQHSLETKLIEGLFFAGQINGTTGYEEAASQGLMAGINAHRKVNGQNPLILKRSDAYIGVLIDDLITKGTEEPYRMFTSRAEYRILLRQDNADLRLTPLAHEMGLASTERLERVQEKQKNTKEFLSFLKETSVDPKEANPILNGLNSAEIDQKRKLDQLLSRPQVGVQDLLKIASVKEFADARGLSSEELEQTEIQLKYKGYIDREHDNAQKLVRLEGIRIPDTFDFDRLQSLSLEAREKLNEIRPVNIAQASRISGVNPADINVLLVHMGR